MIEVELLLFDENTRTFKCFRTVYLPCVPNRNDKIIFNSRASGEEKDYICYVYDVIYYAKQDIDQTISGQIEDDHTTRNKCIDIWLVPISSSTAFRSSKFEDIIVNTELPKFFPTENERKTSTDE